MKESIKTNRIETSNSIRPKRASSVTDTVPKMDLEIKFNGTKPNWKAISQVQGEVR